MAGTDPTTNVRGMLEIGECVNLSILNRMCM